MDMAVCLVMMFGTLCIATTVIFRQTPGNKLPDHCVRLGTFFDIQNRLLLLTSKIQNGYWFFHHIKNRLLVWTYVSKQVPVIDNLGVQLSVVQVVWTIQNHVTIYDLIANTGCLAKKTKPVIGLCAENETGYWFQTTMLNRYRLLAIPERPVPSPITVAGHAV